MKENAHTYLDHLYSLDFKERPVSVNQFLDDPTYLGNSTKNGNIVYPCWRETLSELMEEDSKYLAVFTGAIGCLGDSVKIQLLDGRSVTIPQIIKERANGKQHWVYSYDISNGCVVP